MLGLFWGFLAFLFALEGNRGINNSAMLFVCLIVKAPFRVAFEIAPKVKSRAKFQTRFQDTFQVGKVFCSFGRLITSTRPANKQNYT